MKKSIYFKLVSIFFCVIISSIIVSFFITSFIYSFKIKNTLQKTLNNTVENIESLYKNNNKSSINSIINMDIFHISNISIYDKDGLVDEFSKNNSHITIPKDEVLEVLDGKNHHSDINSNTYLDSSNKYFASSFKFDDTTYALFIKPINLFNALGIHKWMFLNLCIVLILGTISYMIVAKNIVKPIKAITLASKYISNGSYDIQVQNRRKDELGELINTFNYMISELNKTETMRQEFVSSVSHEIRTPLTTIKGFSTLLSYDTLSVEDRRYYSNIINEETSRLSLLSENLLRLSSLDNIHDNIKKDDFFIDEEIRKSILSLESKWSIKNITFELNLPKVNITGDKDLLFHVWTNLIENAIKFSNEGSIINISLEETTEYINIIFKDYGMGISKENINRIFERFYKSDSSRNTNGTGLGLSIVSKIISIHDGEINVKSELNKGTTFIIKLPIKYKNLKEIN
ncbi:HAMP domain-containing sensor histidine kinase [Clostridium sardiniense]|uniref:HAMP domain-containing sensor histidine kinase n=1 Tax=Clostridium sardiniense TaxID=29369 RepID=UPI00195DC4DE|nr:HAMP domain-containing sensor histidine kinase [Clostridium sardiniense]MBM7834431.1 signal transduction histidine kinase [Clostridium sardiniense]